MSRVLCEIRSTGTALTEHVYEQEEIMDGFIRYWKDRPYNRSLLERFFSSVKVETRHLALPIDQYPALGSFTESNKRFKEVATDLAQRAVTRALKSGGLTPIDVDAIFFTTVTGATVPSIDAVLINRLGFRRDVKRSPFFGLGCVAGAAGVARMADYLKAWPDHVALLISVELTSLTLQKDDLSIPAIVSAALFGDGAAAVVGVGRNRIANGPGDSSRPRVIATRSIHYPDTEHVMGWDIGTEGFRVVLSAEVPQVVEEHLRPDVESFLATQGRGLQDIRTWVCHPGGPRVIEAIERSLGLDKTALRLTWNSLRSIGNLSSGSVLFILDETMRLAPGEPGSLGLMTAMGPGFCSELVLLEW